MIHCASLPCCCAKGGGSRTAPTKSDILDIDIAVLRADLAFVGATLVVALVVARESPTRFLRVVTLDDGETIHNAFFDRGFRKEMR